jgi:sulfhydrogenase subunit alpha
VTRRLSVDMLTRVEGHGGVEVVLDGGEVKDVKFNVFEGPRFFENIIKTVNYEKIPDMTRRICAICTASHSLASIGAIENAFGVENTRQTELLRDLLIHGEMIESHALHVYMLALPDFLGYPDAIAMSADYADAVKNALALKKAGNMIHTTLSGRDVHGMNERVGGFSKVPNEGELAKVKTMLEKVQPAAELAVELFKGFELPAHNESDNVHMAIDPGDRFGYLGAHVLVSGGERHPQEDYMKLTNEKVHRHSYAKHSTYNGAPFMVGALPRVHLSHGKLTGTASGLYREHSDMVDPRNTLSNNFCQALELVHDVERGVETIDALLSEGLEDEGLTEFEAHEGRGINAVEAPRGLLYHDYSFDEDGCISRANIITPTAQNAANIEKDVRVIAGNHAGGDAELINDIEVMIRAYDPCISCSVHLVRLR